MERKYKISGMTCNGCRDHVQEKLLKMEGVVHVTVNLERGEATVEMDSHPAIETMQTTFDDAIYAIHLLGSQPDVQNLTPKPLPGGTGIWYCPMHCEGEKVYSQPGDCPVCGMDLVEEAQLQPTDQHYTCPMHPEVISGEQGACPECGMALIPVEVDESAENKTYKTLLSKFWIAGIFTVPIFLIAMSEMLPENPLLSVAAWKYWGWVQLTLSIPVVFYATWMFFKRAYSSIIRRSPNMFTLIGIGAGVAWLFSLIGLLFPEIFPDQFKSGEETVNLYFEAATVILTLVLLGQLLEARAHGKTNRAIKELLKLAPNTATLLINGFESKVKIEDIKVGDLLRVKPGEKIPVDGTIHEGKSTIDESMINGEPIPVVKSEGEQVTSGTINGQNSFVMKAEKVGADTLLSQIIAMVNHASRSRAPIQNLADKISGYFVPIVIGVSILTFVLWMIWGPAPKLVYAFVNAIAVLIIACPCALGLATPMSVMVGVGKGAKMGVLIKNAASLEKMNKIDVLIIDKTGTITEGRPSVEHIILASGYQLDRIIEVVASVNQQSEHPLAASMVRYAKEKGITPLPITHFESITGKGVKGIINGQVVIIGNEKLLVVENIAMDPTLLKQAKKEQTKGKTVSFVAIDEILVGFVVITDAVKPTSKQAIIDLQSKGIDVVMMTGDHALTANAVANALHLDDFQADCLPEDKLNRVKSLQSTGKNVAMAGDGINDAPALALADVGIAMGTGTDVAIESAAITLVKGDLQGIVKAYGLSHQVMKNIKQNLFFALLYNTLGIPMAAGALFPFFGILLSPMLAALAMSFSSVSVISNALRLRTQTIN